MDISHHVITAKKCYNIFVLILVATIMVMGFASSATLPPVEKDKCTQLKQTCANCTFVNVTAVEYPNGNIETFIFPMQKNVNVFNLSFCNTSELGTYIYYTIGNPNGELVSQSIDFKVTGNGREEADGFVVVLFGGAFIIIMGFLIFSMANLIVHFAKFDYDINDLSYNVGVYFAFLAFYFLQDFYLGNVMIGNISETIVQVGAVTHGFIPFLALFISIIFRVSTKRSFKI